MSSGAESSAQDKGGEDPNKQRQSNLQRIQQRKQSVREWPKDKKMEKLAIYSSCKEDENCKCNGWKNPNPPPNPPRPDAPQPTSSPSDPCRSCHHTFRTWIIVNCKLIQLDILQFLWPFRLHLLDDLIHT